MITSTNDNTNSSLDWLEAPMRTGWNRRNLEDTPFQPDKETNLSPSIMSKNEIVFNFEFAGL